MKRSEAGFTLFEVILAIAVFAVASLLIGTTLFAMQRSWSRIKKQSENLKDYQAIDRIVDYAVRNAVPFKWRNKNLKDSLVFKGDSDEVILAYLHRITDMNQGGIRFIKLSLEEDRLITYYRNTPILYWLDEDMESTCSKEIIAEGVERISFLYADRDAKGINWQNDWNEELEENIPLAIQLTIEFKDGRKAVWLRRTAGSSFESNLGKRANRLK